MAGRKIFLANILYNSNLLNLFQHLPLKNRLIVLNYHRIRPETPGSETLFDDGVFSLRIDQFAMQVKWLKEKTHIFSENDLIDFVRAPAKISRPGILITFDDGYRDNYTIAYPILKSYQVPAIFFVTTKPIDDRRLGWWDLIAYIIKQSPRPSADYDENRFDLTADRRPVIDFFHQKMKLEPYEKTRHLIEDLQEIFEVALPDSRLQDEQLLTWDQIREMSAANFSIGSHTHSHRVLATLDPIAQREEMVLSKLILEQKTGQEINSIAYPVGGTQHFTMETEMLARQCGYFFGFTCDSGVNLLQIEDLFAVKRVSGMLEDIRTVSALVVLPDLFMWNKAVSKHEEVLREHPDYADFSFRLGILYMGQGKIEQAIESLQEALQRNPGYVEARIKLGISQANLGHYDDATDNLKTVLAQHPNYADVHYLLGLVQSGRRQFSEAVESLETAVKLNPNYKDARIKLGALYFHLHQFNAGLKQLEAASRFDPTDTDLLAAVEAAQQSISAQASDSEILESLQQNLFGQDVDLSQTIAELTTHIDISPNLSDMLSIITNFSETGDALEILVPLFEDYLEQYPRYSDLHNTFGTLNLKLNRLAEAEAAFRKALDLSPKYLKARLNLFNTLIRESKFEEALEEARFIDPLNLPYPDYYASLGEAYLGLSRYDEAEKSMRKAVELNSKYVKARLLLAQIYKVKGEPEAARAELEEILAQNPSPDLAQKVLDQLQHLKNA